MKRLCCLGLALSTLTILPASAARKLDFNRDVRPILSDKCFACHGPDTAKNKGGLRLDTRDFALKGGKSDGAAIVLTKPEDSPMLKRLLTTDADEHMPPKESAKEPLTETQIATLRQWIAEGAEYQGHWAFLPPVRPALPTVTQFAAQIPNPTPIDTFILARLAEEGLSPAPQADRRTLIRRVTLDLTGLPPTLAEVNAFVNDAAPNAYEKAVDRLLASPHYGERMAMPWLDNARYADSNGFQTDTSRYQWPWRDWVIAAFNRNLPFDQFTIEQLAGDLLPNPKPDQIVASGFNRNHRLNGEGGLIQAEWFVETVIDRLETTGTTWMALTFNCCRCHDHKYDPISQKEFYQMFSYFNSVDEAGILAGDSRNTEPILRLDTPERQARIAVLASELADAEARQKSVLARLPELQTAWEKSVLPPGSEPTTWLSPQPASMAADNATLTQESDAIFASGSNPGADTYRITYQTTAATTLTALRLTLLPDDRLPSKGPGRHPNGNPIVSEFQLKILASEGQPEQIATLKTTMATFNQHDWESAKAIDNNPGTGWAIHPEVGKEQSCVFVLARPLDVPAKASLAVSMIQNYGSGATVGKFRISFTTSKNLTAIPDPILALIRKLPTTRTPEEQKSLTDYFIAEAGEVTEAKALVDRATRAKAEFEAAIPTTMVMKELPTPKDAFVLKRGEYDKPGDKVERLLPAFLPPLPIGEQNNRLGLARWLVSGQHPLTARVWVNRAWERFFGQGLCKTTENFGSQSDFPSHPELLDWLATEFVRLGWDMKAMQKEMVLSATYRQASTVTPELLEKDADNRLLARSPRVRLSGEVLRDQALAIAGLLQPKIGGPSVRPYMPEGVWDETSRYGDLRGYKNESGEGLYRRTLYTIWKRSAGPPTLQLFDAPTRDVCTIKRSRTNTPLQALALLNEITFVEAARVFAQRMISEGGTAPEARFTWAMENLLARPPTASELQVLTAGFATKLAHFQSSPEDAKKLATFGETKAPTDTPELAAYTLMANILLNLDEIITRE